MFDFANILFSGPCNARCPMCIGRRVDPSLNLANLDRYPPLGLDGLVESIHRHGVRQVVFTGTDTDPLLYKHGARLLVHLWTALPPGTQFSLHTNGRLAVQKMELLNAFDRVAISLPSFRPDVYRRMMGVSGVPDMGRILERARVPIKVSCLVTDDNASSMSGFLASCQGLGVGRVVLRKPVGETRPWETLIDIPALGLEPRCSYRQNPIYGYRDVQVTLWDFDRTTSRSINLFSSGLISESYLLMEAAACQRATSGAGDREPSQSLRPEG